MGDITMFVLSFTVKVYTRMHRRQLCAALILPAAFILYQYKGVDYQSMSDPKLTSVADKNRD